MTIKVLVCLVSLAVIGVGCKPNDNPAGYTKEDFKRSAPPPDWRGPGQTGAPGGAAGSPSGPGAAAQPPANIVNGAASKTGG